MTQLIGIPWIAVPDYWGQVEPHIARCLAKAKEHRWNADDIYDMLIARDLQLYLVEEEGTSTNVVLTRIDRYPRCTECNVFMWSGNMPDDWREVMAQLTQWARAAGCTYASATTRKGFVKLVGWEERQTYIVEKL